MTHTCTHMDTDTQRYKHAHRWTHTCGHGWTHTHIGTQMDTHVCTLTQTHTWTHAHADMHMCGSTHKYLDTQAHRHTDTQTCGFSSHDKGFAGGCDFPVQQQRVRSEMPPAAPLKGTQGRLGTLWVPFWLHWQLWKPVASNARMLSQESEVLGMSAP